MPSKAITLSAEPRTAAVPCTPCPARLRRLKERMRGAPDLQTRLQYTVTTARIAYPRSILLHPSSPRLDTSSRKLLWNVSRPAEVDLVRRSPTKSVVREFRVVFVDVEFGESANRGEAVEVVE